MLAGNEGSEKGLKPVLHSETMYRELESSYKSDPRWLVSDEAPCHMGLHEIAYSRKIKDHKWSG